MKLASAYSPILGGAALALGVALSSPLAQAQSSQYHLPEPVRIGQKGAPVQVPPSPLSSVPTEQYSHGNPSAEEQYVLELINRARSNPTAEGIFLAETTDPQVLAAYAFFNIDKNKLKTDFAGYPVRPPLAFNPKLMTAARNHGQDMYDNDFQGHTGSNGSQLADRLGVVGYTGWTWAGENVAARSYHVTYGHIGLNVDWGVASLGHRKNIMSYEEGVPVFSEIGISALHKSPSGANTGPVILTEVFGNANRPYLLGVVYRDLNNNNFYDVGEGLSGVTVMPSAGTYFAVTSESGGYAIPVTSSMGNITVTASGGALTSPVVLSATTGTENVKLDFKAGTPSLPGIVSLIAPTDESIVASPQMPLVWEQIAGATTYHLQVSNQSNFSTMLVNDSTLTGDSKMMTALENNATYYWRVRAKNDAGWGSFSAANSFTVELALPLAVSLVTPANGATVVPDAVKFSWNRSVPDVRKYWIEVSTTADMSNVVARDTSVTDTFKVFTGTLQHNTTYYWQVRAKNQAGWGPYSSVRNLTTATSSVNDPVTGGNAFALTGNMPNPFSGVTRINFTLAQPGEITLKVLNGVGEEVATIASGRFAADRHELLWDASNLAAGIYYCQLRMGERVETMKMVVAR